MCARALTRGSLDDADMTDDLTDFNEKEMKAVEKQVEFYREKYKVSQMMKRIILSRHCPATVLPNSQLTTHQLLQTYIFYLTLCRRSEK